MRTKQFDEFIAAGVIGDYRGMRDGDGVLCFNFRADRVREILAAILDPAFAGFPRRAWSGSPRAVGMTRVLATSSTRFMRDDLPAAALPNILGEVVAARRPHAAAHGRDREVSARHLFPQRRRARSPIPARTASWCRRPRSRPTTCSRRCRRRS